MYVRDYVYVEQELEATADFHRLTNHHMGILARDYRHVDTSKNRLFILLWRRWFEFCCCSQIVL